MFGHVVFKVFILLFSVFILSNSAIAQVVQLQFSDNIKASQFTSRGSGVSNVIQLPTGAYRAKKGLKYFGLKALKTLPFVSQALLIDEMLRGSNVYAPQPVSYGLCRLSWSDGDPHNLGLISKSSCHAHLVSGSHIPIGYQNVSYIIKGNYVHLEGSNFLIGNWLKTGEVFESAQEVMNRAFNDPNNPNFQNDLFGALDDLSVSNPSAFNDLVDVGMTVKGSAGSFWDENGYHTWYVDEFGNFYLDGQLVPNTFATVDANGNLLLNDQLYSPTDVTQTSILRDLAGNITGSTRTSSTVDVDGNVSTTVDTFDANGNLVSSITTNENAGVNNNQQQIDQLNNEKSSVNSQSNAITGKLTTFLDPLNGNSGDRNTLLKISGNGVNFQTDMADDIEIYGHLDYVRFIMGVFGALFAFGIVINQIV